MTESDVTNEATNADNPSDVVRRFLERWSVSKAAALASFDEFFTPETVWENVGMGTTVGIDEARAMSENLLPDFETMIVEFKFIEARGRYVFTDLDGEIHDVLVAGDSACRERGRLDM